MYMFVSPTRKSSGHNLSLRAQPPGNTAPGTLWLVAWAAQSGCQLPAVAVILTSPPAAVLLLSTSATALKTVRVFLRDYKSFSPWDSLAFLFTSPFPLGTSEHCPGIGLTPPCPHDGLGAHHAFEPSPKITPIA